MAASVRWSVPPERVAQQLLAVRPIGFAIRYRHLLRWRQVDFALTPLGELTLMDDQFTPFAETADGAWLLWQSATGSAVTTSLPCDAAKLCQRLALVEPGPHHVATAEALTAVVEAAWRQGGVPG
jgi:hypothetical protein